MSQKRTDALTYDFPSLYFHLCRYCFMGNALESFSVKTQPVCNDIALYQLGPCTVRPTLFLNFLFHVEQTERYEIDIFFD